jgi:hypothetical protein
MPYTTNEGRALPRDKSFTHNNKSFGASWLRQSSAQQKDAEGIKWVTVPEAPVVRAPLEREKADELRKAKDTSYKRLQHSDWRQLPGNNMPEDWGVFRQATRDEFNRIETAISAAESYEDLDAIKQEWPLNPYEQAERDQMEAEEKEAQDEDV